jgi:hypothetical protein
MASAAAQVKTLRETLLTLAESGAGDAVRELLDPLQSATGGTRAGEEP